MRGIYEELWRYFRLLDEILDLPMRKGLHYTLQRETMDEAVPDVNEFDLDLQGATH